MPALRTRFDGISIALHWTTVVLIILLFGLAETWGFFPRPVHRQMVMVHLTLGVLLTAVLLSRIGWRLAPSHRVASVVSGWDDRASRAVQGLLYLLMIAQVLLGWAARWSEGAAMPFLGLQIPPMIPHLDRAVTHQLEEIHGKVGWAIIILALGHAGAALYHHFILKDQVLSRMLPTRGAAD